MNYNDFTFIVVCALYILTHLIFLFKDLVWNIRRKARKKALCLCLVNRLTAKRIKKENKRKAMLQKMK